MISLYFPALIWCSATDLLIQTQQLALTFNLAKVLQHARQMYRNLLELPVVPCSLAPLVGALGNEAGSLGNLLPAWDGYRTPNFSCFQCEKKGTCGRVGP